MPIRAVTLDLDDTIWPFAPVTRKIDAALRGWMEEHAPGLAPTYSQAAVNDAIALVRAERDDLAHDLSGLRREVMRRLLAAAGEDPELAEPAFAVVYAARQEIELYPEAAAALDRLAALVPMWAITNGNADIGLTGVAHWFGGCVSAESAGVAKPAARPFELACSALGLPPADVLHAGDDLDTDVGGALAAGMQAVWVRRGADGEAPAGAHVVEDMGALADLVELSLRTGAAGPAA